MLADLIAKNRSYRRFDESVSISTDVLRELVGYARLSATGGNQQSIKFLLSNTPELNAKIFPPLAWAGSLKDWDGPEEGERPSAYIVIVGDAEVSKGFGVNHGIAAQSILLGAVEKGLGGCMVGAIQRDQLRQALRLPDRYEILLVVALGKPAETVVTEDAVGGNVTYYRDESSVHHVPKRPLDELIVEASV